MSRKRTYFFDGGTIANNDVDPAGSSGATNTTWIHDSSQEPDSPQALLGNNLYALERINSQHTTLPGSGSPVINSSIIWPVADVFDGMSYALDPDNAPRAGLFVLIDLPYKEILDTVYIYKEAGEWPEHCGDTLEVTLRVHRFAATLICGGIPEHGADSDDQPEQSPITSIGGAQTVTLSRPVESGDGVVGGEDCWEKLGFRSIGVENNYTGDDLHSKFLLEFSIAYPDRPQPPAYGPDDRQRFYKVQAISIINGLQSALNLY